MESASDEVYLMFFKCSSEDGSDVYLTKGDNNNVNDRFVLNIIDKCSISGLTAIQSCSGLYADGQKWLKRTDVVGIARG